MTDAPSLWSFVANADAVVKTVLIILVLASVFSWTIIVQRAKAIKQAKLLMREFEDTFWSGIDLSDYYRQLEAQGNRSVGLSQIFQAGFREFLQKQAQHTVGVQRLQGIARAMRSTQARYLEDLSGRSDWLATIGSISPYVGLFGTVWGIMSSFRSLGMVQQATISMVAPGIAEALIATAIGLLAAIPAVVAHNRFTAQLEAIGINMDNFSDELLNILQRQVEQQPESMEEAAHAGA
jgi:biopolymer transport protein TolQ